jgi:hypothetical protein
MSTFKIEFINSGHCIVIYSSRNEHDEKIIYGLYDNGKQGVTFYRCSQDGEPMYEAKIKDGRTINIELPKGDSRLELLIRDYINNNDRMTGF